VEQKAQFQYESVFDTKTIVAEDGDIIVAGYASDFDVDRDGEAFEPNAFNTGLLNYLASNPILLYSHDPDKCLGAVEEAYIDEKGLFIKARVAKPAAGSWAEDVYNKIKRGFIRAFSVGGFFKRKDTDQGTRIFDVDLAEISCVPVPANPRTLFSVASKAFKNEEEVDKKVRLAEALEKLNKSLSRLNLPS
jgi:HK97 family phage prohead protease